MKLMRYSAQLPGIPNEPSQRNFLTSARTSLRLHNNFQLVHNFMLENSLVFSWDQYARKLLDEHKASVRSYMLTGTYSNTGPTIKYLLIIRITKLTFWSDIYMHSTDQAYRSSYPIRTKSPVARMHSVLLFIFAPFNDAHSTLRRTVRWYENGLERCGCGLLIWGFIRAFSWRDWEEIWNSSITIVVVPEPIPSGHHPNELPLELLTKKICNPSPVLCIKMRIQNDEWSELAQEPAELEVCFLILAESNCK
jgi:hypothetical protein